MPYPPCAERVLLLRLTRTVTPGESGGGCQCQIDTGSHHMKGSDPHGTTYQVR